MGRSAYADVFCELCLASRSECSLCLVIFVQFLLSFFQWSKVFSVSSQQGCMPLQKFIMRGKTFMIFIFSSGMSSQNRIKHRNRYCFLGENPISSFSVFSLFLITDTSLQNTNHISFQKPQDLLWLASLAERRHPSTNTEAPKGSSVLAGYLVVWWREKMKSEIFLEWRLTMLKAVFANWQKQSW